MRYFQIEYIYFIYLPTLPIIQDVIYLYTPWNLMIQLGRMPWLVSWVGYNYKGKKANKLLFHCNL
jgi:hypothetical protein